MIQTRPKLAPFGSGGNGTDLREMGSGLAIQHREKMRECVIAKPDPIPLTPSPARIARQDRAKLWREDEAKIDMSERAGRTWGLIGNTPTVKASGQRGKFNVLSLVTKEGCLEYDLTQGIVPPFDIRTIIFM